MQRGHAEGKRGSLGALRFLSLVVAAWVVDEVSGEQLVHVLVHACGHLLVPRRLLGVLAQDLVRGLARQLLEVVPRRDPPRGEEAVQRCRNAARSGRRFLARAWGLVQAKVQARERAWCRRAGLGRALAGDVAAPVLTSLITRALKVDRLSPSLLRL